jgi:hypothetical protein
MTWSAAASLASVATKKTAMATRIAAGKKLCPAHDDGVGAWLPLEEFGAARGRPDGRHGWCRACASRAKREARAANPDIAAADRARCAARRAQIKAAETAKAEAQAKAAAAAQAQATRQARARAAQAIIDGEAPLLFGDLITPADVPGLAPLRAARIRAQVEADQQRTAMAAAWRRGSRQPPVPFDPGPELHALGWSR